MFKSTILKLREEESTRSDINGTFSTNLSTSVVINEGDQISIKSAFLDTTTESSITIQEDFTATLSTCRYLTNYYDGVDASLANPFRTTGANKNCTFATGGPTPPPVPFSTAVGPDLQKYWACETFAGSSTNKLLERVTIIPNSTDKFYGSGDRKDRQFFFQIEYRDPTKPSAEATYVPSGYINVPKTKYQDHPTLDLELGILVNVAPGTQPIDNVRIKPFTGSEIGNWGKFGMNIPVFVAEDFNTSAQTDPFVKLIEDKCEIDIAKGVYTPAELSTIITDKMSVLARPGSVNLGVDYSKGDFLVDSPFLSSMFQEYFKVFSPDGESLPTATQGDPTIIYMGEENYGLFSHYLRIADQSTDNLLGANNASLNYDESLDKLNFDVLHFPVQVDSNGVNTPGIVYNPESSTNPEDYKHGAVLSYSGSGITNFDPPQFWSQLGFGTENTITAKHITGNIDYAPGFYIDPTTGASTALTPASRTLHKLDIRSVAGVNCTQQYAPMDLVVTSVAVASPAVQTWMQPDLNTAGIASAITTPVLGNRQFSGSVVNDGFYMINIGTNLPQTMIASNKLNVTGSNKLQSIVGKFYTQGNFLQDEGSGSISYTHVGPPQLLNQLDIQILNGDGSNPSNTDIGNNTTIFLEIIKPVVRPVPPPPNQSK